MDVIVKLERQAGSFTVALWSVRVNGKFIDFAAQAPAKGGSVKIASQTLLTFTLDAPTTI